MEEVLSGNEPFNIIAVFNVFLQKKKIKLCKCLC